ncbi:MAG: hypothetical protein IJU72_09335 [Bacteroidales bacterium]|nr:hypothetical protein [Bacteroidales bacterium]
MTTVANMPQGEREAYEAQRGYISIGSESERFYESVDFDSYNDAADFHQLVADNSDLLQLVVDEDSELTLETRFHSHPARYLINRDGLAIIGDTAAKVFENGTFKAHRRNLQQVAKLQCLEDCPAHIGRMEQVNIISKTIDFGAKSSACQGTEHQWHSTNGNNRLRARILITSDPIRSSCELLARPYKRTLGAWYWCSRTMKVDATVTWGYKPDNQQHRTTNTLVFFHDYERTTSLKRTETLKFNTGNYSGLGFDSLD